MTDEAGVSSRSLVTNLVFALDTVKTFSRWAYRQLTVVIRLPAIDPFGLTSTGKLNYHISVCRSAALRAGGKGRYHSYRGSPFGLLRALRAAVTRDTTT